MRLHDMLSWKYMNLGIISIIFKLFILSNTKRGYGDIEYIQVPAKVCSPAINWSMIKLRNTALRAHAIKGRLVLRRYCFQIKLLLLHSMHCRRKPILWLWIPVKGTHQEANIHFQNAIKHIWLTWRMEERLNILSSHYGNEYHFLSTEYRNQIW